MVRMVAACEPITGSVFQKPNIPLDDCLSRRDDYSRGSAGSYQHRPSFRTHAILGLQKNGHHLITKLKSNAVAYKLPAKQDEKESKGRGRPKTYGDKIKIASLMKDKSAFSDALSPSEQSALMKLDNLTPGDFKIIFECNRLS